MRYNVSQLLKGPTGGSRSYKLNEEIGKLDPELKPSRPLIGTITLMRTTQGILVTGRLKTGLEGVCKRCLEPCELKVTLDLEEQFYPVAVIDDVPLDDTPEEERDEALVIDERHQLDLGEVVRQGLWLAMPMEALCRPDCAGLCPHCGGNRNLGECRCDRAPLDPRWAALQALLTDTPDSNERSD